MSGNVFQGGKPPFAELLATADLIEFYHDEGPLGFEVSRWVVEGEMAVFSDAHECHIHDMAADKRTDPPALRCRVFSLSVYEIDRFQITRSGEEPFGEVSAETRRMVGL